MWTLNLHNNIFLPSPKYLAKNKIFYSFKRVSALFSTPFTPFLTKFMNEWEDKTNYKRENLILAPTIILISNGMMKTCLTINNNYSSHFT